jgi:hypothetical protein
MAKVKLGTALYKLRKERGLLTEAEKNHRFPSFSERKSVLDRNPNSWQSRFKIPQDWTHDIHGSVFGASVTDLIRLFPQQNLREACLSRVKNGKQTSHKGWRASGSKPQEKSVIIMGSVPVSTETKTKSDYCMDLINRGS